MPVPVPFPSRHDQQPVPGTLMVPTQSRSDAQASGDRVDSRLRLRSEFPWLASGQLPDVLLGQRYLAQQGYVILTPDYRGSSGYSRNWATGVHMGLGVTDAADVASGADYLKTLDYVDPDRIGVWGLSYGGFLTLQAMTRDPRSGVRASTSPALSTGPTLRA